MASGAKETYEFAGFTSSTMSGGTGYRNMTSACVADFGSSARVATSEKAATSKIESLSGAAWLRGVLHASDPGIDAISGINTGNDLTCRGRSEAGSVLGLIVNGSDLTMSTQFCYQQAAVACSVPE